MTGNIAALAGADCKVFVDDLASSITGLGGTGREGVRDDHIAELLGGTRKESVDLVLAWNLLNYLPLVTISVLAGRLRECCTAGALVHFLLYNTQWMPGEPGRFRIAPGALLEFDADSAMTVKSPRHSPRTLQENMPGFDIHRMFLLGSGNQECLFAAV